VVVCWTLPPNPNPDHSILVSLSDFRQKLHDLFLRGGGDAANYKFSTYHFKNNGGMKPPMKALTSAQIKCGGCSFVIKASPHGELAKNVVKHIKSKRCAYNVTNKADGHRLLAYLKKSPIPAATPSSRKRAFTYGAHPPAKKAAQSGIIEDDHNDSTWSLLNAANLYQNVR
jgi:hypothetical protein